MDSRIARAEVERLVTALAERDRTLIDVRAELDQVRQALQAAPREHLALVTATVPVLQSRHGITPQALAKLDATVAQVLEAGVARHHSEPALAAEFRKLALYLDADPRTRRHPPSLAPRGSSAGGARANEADPCPEDG